MYIPACVQHAMLGGDAFESAVPLHPARHVLQFSSAAILRAGTHQGAVVAFLAWHSHGRARAAMPSSCIIKV